MLPLHFHCEGINKLALYLLLCDVDQNIYHFFWDGERNRNMIVFSPTLFCRFLSGGYSWRHDKHLAQYVVGFEADV